jgi:3-methyladenine DNA glycosylase AlkD
MAHEESALKRMRCHVRQALTSFPSVPVVFFVVHFCFVVQWRYSTASQDACENSQTENLSLSNGSEAPNRLITLLKLSRNRRRMADISALAAEIDARLHTLPTHTTDSVRALRKEYTRQLASQPAGFVTALAFELLRRPQFDLRFIAYELIHFHRPALRSLDAEMVQQLSQGIDSWVSVDTLCMFISGPAWRNRQIDDDFIARWARSPDRWYRRAALASTVPLNNKARGGKGDSARTLAVCRLLAADHDDMVVKALSWALRSLIQYDPEGVQNFLDTHKDVLAARVPREVGNKLRTGLKNPRQRKTNSATE